MIKATIAHARQITLPVYSDYRGSLTKLLMASQVSGNRCFGEIYLVRAKPGQRRGGHFHKITNEWFFLLEGQATLRLADYRGSEITYELKSEEPTGIYVPAGLWHEFKASSDSRALILAYADKEYDPKAPDTYSSHPSNHAGG